MLGADAAARLEAVDAGQVNIHQYEVRVQAPGGHDRVFAGLRLADDLEAARRIHDLARYGPKRFLVVADQDLHSHAPQA